MAELSLADEVRQRVLSAAKGEKPADSPPLKQVKEEMMSVSARELRALAETNKNHPCAKVFLEKALPNHPDDAMVAVERISLLAIIENKDIIEKQVDRDEFINGVRIQVRETRKALVEFPAEIKPKPTPAVAAAKAGASSL
jgi:hypothetical protein